MIIIIAVLISWAGIYQSEDQSQSKPDYLFEIGIPDSLYSSTLDEQRNTWAHLPENHKADGTRKYTVVYALDGSAEKFTQFIEKELIPYFDVNMPLPPTES